jgi:hypothetical protein
MLQPSVLIESGPLAINFDREFWSYQRLIRRSSVYAGASQPKLQIMNQKAENFEEHLSESFEPRQADGS